MSRVVDIHSHKGVRPHFDIYIGRRVRFHNEFTKDSKWANPFPRRPGSLEDYEKRIRNTPELWGSLEELDGKVLGCWCTDTDSIQPPFRCHGQVLMKLLWEKKLLPTNPKKPCGYCAIAADCFFKGLMTECSGVVDVTPFVSAIRRGEATVEEVASVLSGLAEEEVESK